MFSKIMNYIKDFLENTPGDIYEFSVVLEDALVDNYDEMYKEQPRATEVLADETPDICASAEPGMKSEEINEFKCKLKMEYDKALKAIVQLPPVVIDRQYFCTIFQQVIRLISIQITEHGIQMCGYAGKKDLDGIDRVCAAASAMTCNLMHSLWELIGEKICADAEKGMGLIGNIVEYKIFICYMCDF